MALLPEVKEDYKGLLFDSQTEGRTIEQTFTRRFEVLYLDDTISMMNRVYLAKNDPHIPAEWDSHPSDEWLYVDHKTCRAVGPLLYEVLVYYVSDPDPLNQPAKVSWSHAESDEPIDRDINGLPIVNSVGESPDPPITKEVNDILLRIERNEQYFDSQLAEEYKGAINSDDFYGYLPGKVKCITFAGTPVRAAWLEYYQVTYEFQIRVRDNWKRRILDQGFRTKTGVDAEGTPIYAVCADSEGIPLSQPVLLDGLGDKKADDADAVFLEFDLLDSKPFSQLGL